jgi:signal transduction histidine kinase
MINRSIDLFKMEKGTYALHAQPVDALHLIRQIADALKEALAAKNIAIDVSVQGKSPADGQTFQVMAEEMLLYSMLANLIKNAVEASPRGGRIAVSLRREEACTLAIHNPGCIPEGIRGRFMQKFATSGKEHGTGLGAYSAKLIATTLGGTVDFSTSEADGTTITVRLPA